jgi:hypothetical protein
MIPLFPDLLISMLRVWEETAQIGDTIIKIADFYDEEVDIAIGNIQKMIEPIILAVMAVVIGFIAIGIFQPIMNLAGTFNPMKFEGNAFIFEEATSYLMFEKLVRYLENIRYPWDKRTLLQNLENTTL